MKALAAIPIALALMGAGLPPLPAVEHRKSSVTKVWFVPLPLVQPMCIYYGAKPPPKGKTILGCAVYKLRMIIMPNPCDFNEFYARLQCHENAHFQGMSHD